MIEILNVRKTKNGFLINGYYEVPSNYPQVAKWIEEKNEVMPEFSGADLKDQALIKADILKSEAKKAGKPYIMNGSEYIVPLDKDAQDTVTAITTGYIAAVVTSTLNENTINTIMEFTNGTFMPITTADWMAFATWFKNERNSFFEVVA